MHTNTLSNALPIVAAAYGRKFGVSVQVGGDQAATDGQVIRLPAIQDDPTSKTLAWGYLAHEAGHIRHTDFSAWQSVTHHPLTKAITNILEDVRIENAMIGYLSRDPTDTRCGARLDDSGGSDRSAQGRPEPARPSWPTPCWSWHATATASRPALARLAQESERVLRQVFPPSFVHRLLGLMTEIPVAKEHGGRGGAGQAHGRLDRGGGRPGGRTRSRRQALSRRELAGPKRTRRTTRITVVTWIKPAARMLIRINGQTSASEPGTDGSQDQPQDGVQDAKARPACRPGALCRRRRSAQGCLRDSRTRRWVPRGTAALSPCSRPWSRTQEIVSGAEHLEPGQGPLGQADGAPSRSGSGPHHDAVRTVRQRQGLESRPPAPGGRGRQPSLRAQGGAAGTQHGHPPAGRSLGIDGRRHRIVSPWRPRWHWRWHWSPSEASHGRLRRSLACAVRTIGSRASCPMETA